MESLWLSPKRCLIFEVYPLLKRILNAPFVRVLLTWIAARYIKFVRSTGVWQIYGENIPDKLLEEGQPFIIAFWHGRLIMMAFSWKRSDLVNMLISSHRDGQLVAGMISHFGSKSVFGSSTRGGASAFIQLARLIRGGEIIGITPDGPRGPRMRVHEGVVALARITGAPILPLTVSSSFCHIVNSWDRFMFPFPFGKGVYLWGKPIYVLRDADDVAIEEKRLELENSLLALTQRADWLMNRPDVEPDPLLTRTG